MTGAGEKGRKGETLALAYLTGKGYCLLERNFRSRRGEVDIILKKDDTLVFVEVKYRGKAAGGAGMEAVTPKKQRRILLAAGEYLLLTDQFAMPMRFDVVEITAGGILHVENAFSGDWA